MASSPSFIFFPIFFLLLITQISAACTHEQNTPRKSSHTHLKLTAIAAILISGTIGVVLPIFGRTRVPSLTPGSEIFFFVKAFAGGVILATGFIHILPDAFDSFSSPCLPESPWRRFPFAGLVAMSSAIATMLVDSIASGAYSRENLGKVIQVNNEAESNMIHTHVSNSESEDLRKKVVSKVLELGIVAHSVVIGLSLGASQNKGTIKPLLAALCFHQFFEGLGLGGCISQARFEGRSVAVMAGFFAVTTPAGVGVGMGVARVYNENGVVAVIVEGMLNSASAGILIYMALVDLLSADFMAEKVKSNVRMQIGGYISLILGASCMSALAIWA